LAASHSTHNPKPSFKRDWNGKSEHSNRERYINTYSSLQEGLKVLADERLTPVVRDGVPISSGQWIKRDQ
jgi:hypothetical protein